MMGQHLWFEVADALKQLPQTLGPDEHVLVKITHSDWTATLDDVDTGKTYRVTFREVTP